VLRSGIDIIEVDRVAQAIVRHGERFFDRFYTLQELIDSQGRTPALAARFAMKEAVAKALGTGIGKVGWKEIEVQIREGGKPELHLYGCAQSLAQELGIKYWTISISHTKDHAVAMAIAIEKTSLYDGDPEVMHQ
jgi:holo-[acyl-carrier protein] synthase